MEEQNGGEDNRELYALLNLSPEASDEEIRKAYRQWAQVYHPDKYQDFHMKDIATENFQRICEAYEILSDSNKRQIYDIYGMEGLNSGLELGPRLDKAEEIKAELERLKRMKERQKMLTRFQSSGTILANMSVPHFVDGDGLFRGMAMTSEIQSQLSKRNAITIGGNLAVDGNEGGGAATALFRHQISQVSSIEFVASSGLRSLIGVQTSRNLSSHSAATMGIAMSLRDGSLNLSNLWTRQLSETASGHIQLALGPQSSIAVGWQKKDERRSASGEVKIGTGSFDTSVRYTHRFSPNSLGCIAGRFGSSSLELEVGGGRKISKFSTVRWMYTVGIQGIFWKFELYRGGQKLIIPILLTRHLNPVFATGALVVPGSLYFVLKNFFIKPYYLRRNKQKALEKDEKSSTQIQEARAASEKAQKLLQNVATRKRNKQLETGGLVIMRALYGNQRIVNNLNSSSETSFESTSEVIDVTTPLNFLVNDSGQLKLHEGVKKSGIMGFCDPCPGESKQLYVEYVYAGNQYKFCLVCRFEVALGQSMAEAIGGGGGASCIFCNIATNSTTTTLLHSDDKVVAFQDINPSAFRHYLVIPVEHIPTVKDLHAKAEHYSLVNHMLEVGRTLLHRDAPQSKHYRFGFHQPPLNSVNHLHLHCFALPYTPRWRCIKYMSFGPVGFIEAEKFLEKIKPLSSVHSKV